MPALRAIHLQGAFVFLMVFMQSAEGSGKFDYAALSFGTWIVTNDNTGASSKDSYFQTAKMAAWYHVGKLKGSISIPFTLTFEKYPEYILYAAYPSNGEITFGYQFGAIQPRLGLSFPMGYPLRGTAWIGSGNINGVLGAYFSLFKKPGGDVTIGGDALTRVALTDTSQGARYGRGSVSGYLSLRGSYTRADWKWSFGLFASGSRFVYTDWGGPENSLAVLPMFSAGRRLGSSRELSISFGAGPGWSGEQWGKQQINVSAGVSLGTGL